MDWSLLIGPLFGFASTHLFKGSKQVFKAVDKFPAPLQQLSVLGIAVAGLWGSQWVPGLSDIIALSDPNAAAGIAAATAYGLHRPTRRD